MQVIAKESTSLVVMFLGEDEFHTAAVSHFTAKKAQSVTAQSLFKDLFQPVDDNACKGRGDKASDTPEFTARGADHDVYPACDTKN